MNKFVLFVSAALACAIVHAGYWDGYYVPDMDEVTHLTSFEKANVSMGATWGDNVPVQGTISKTTSAGVTKLDFSYTHPVYGRQTVKWSGQIYWWDIPEFTYGGHRYWICFDAVPLGMQVCVDQDSADEKYFWCEVHLANENPTIPVEWQKARKLTGVFGEGCCRDVSGVDGTCELTCGKANKKGYAKVSLKIAPFAGKKISYSASSVYVGAGGRVDVNFKNQYTVSIESDGSFFGEPYYADIRPDCSPRAVWSATVGGNLPNGAYRLKVGYAFDSEFEAFDTDQWGIDQMFSEAFAGAGCYCLRGDLLAPYSRYGQPCSVSGNKLDFGRAASLKIQVYQNEYGDWVGDLLGADDAAKPNTSGMKVSYNARSGLLKGSFYVYTDPFVCCCWDVKPKSSKLKKYKIEIVGVVVNGRGVGFAECKKPAAGPWPVTLEN